MKIQRQEIKTYEEEIPKNLNEFKEWDFTTGTTTGEDFKVFSRKFKQFVKNNLPENAVLSDFSPNHYILSGFIERNGKFVYFSISDVRFFKNEWADNILIRKAEHIKDFGGGSNSFTSLNNFKADVENLL